MKILEKKLRCFETFYFASTLCVRKTTDFQFRNAKIGCFILDTSFNFSTKGYFNEIGVFQFLVVKCVVTQNISIKYF